MSENGRGVFHPNVLSLEVTKEQQCSVNEAGLSRILSLCRGCSLSELLSSVGYGSSGMLAYVGAVDAI